MVEEKVMKLITYAENELLNALGIKGKLKSFYHSIMNETFEFEMIQELDNSVKIEEVK